MTMMEKIRSNTAGRTYEEVSPVRRKNAVLIPLVEEEDLGSDQYGQGGEICFPGGRIEPRENPEDAAVRETAEELLIPRENIEVIAPMHTMSGPGGARISSCIGILHDYKGTFSKQEVDHVFTVPVSWFASYEPRVSSGAMKVETPEDFPYEFLPGGRDYPWRSIPRKFYFYESRGGVIWGITAQLLYHCLGVILREEEPVSGDTSRGELQA